MSLFIGNISKSVSSSELEKLFSEYGSVRINYKGSYAFAEFDHEKDAEEALDNLKNKDMGGRKINIQWSKKSRKYDESKNRRRSISSRGRNDGRCYNCGRKGHYLRDCKSKRRHSHSRSRSRSRSRRRRSSSRDRRHGHRSSRRRSHSSRSRSRSNSYRKRRRSSSESSSSSRSRSSRDKSYDKKKRSEEKKSSNYKNEDKKRESRSASRSERSAEEKNNNKTNSFGHDQSNENETRKYIYENERDINGDRNYVDESKKEIKSGKKKYKFLIKDSKNYSGSNKDFSKMKNDDLKDELKRRGISYSKNAKKSELIDLLQNGVGNK